MGKYANMKFEPAGITDDSELRIASSLVDYIFRRMALDYLSAEERTNLGVQSTQERMQPTLPGVEEQATPTVGLLDDGMSSGPAAATRMSGLDHVGDPGCALGAGRPAIGPGGTARRAVLLQLRQPHAAGGILLRVRELRDDQRLLVRIRVVDSRAIADVQSRQKPPISRHATSEVLASRERRWRRRPGPPPAPLGLRPANSQLRFSQARTPGGSHAERRRDRQSSTRTVWPQFQPADLADPLFHPRALG